MAGICRPQASCVIVRSLAVVYNGYSVLELLSNLVWLAVAISFWGSWFLRRHGVRKASLLHAVGTEVIALAMLTTVLLPAISITDDLHACQLPAEIKRSILQSDRRLSPAAPPSIQPFPLAMLALFCMSPLDYRGMTFLAVEQPTRPQTRGYLRSLWSRPPPARTA